jgi:hypothetical protein
VGRFPLRVKRVRLHNGRVRVDTALGAWTSEVSFDRSDTTLAGGVLGALLAAFALGRVSGRRSR